jgi:hypothetical protein
MPLGIELPPPHRPEGIARFLVFRNIILQPCGSVCSSVCLLRHVAQSLYCARLHGLFSPGADLIPMPSFASLCRPSTPRAFAGRGCYSWAASESHTRNRFRSYLCSSVFVLSLHQQDGTNVLRLHTPIVDHPAEKVLRQPSSIRACDAYSMLHGFHRIYGNASNFITIAHQLEVHQQV